MMLDSKTLSQSHKHLIVPELLRRKVRVLVVGCGGTGSAIACGLPYLHQAMVAHGHRGLQVTLADADRISETNCVRQPFSLSEVGLRKSTVLINRINLFWGLGWNAVEKFVDQTWEMTADVIIGCVDSRKARFIVSRSSTMAHCQYWLDIGNNADTGQFVLGQPQGDIVKRYSPGESRLPTVSELFPETINVKLDRKDSFPSCSSVEALDRQEPFLNQTLANHALAMLARLFRYGGLTYHGGFVNLSTGKTTPLAVNPEGWARMIARTGKK